MQRKKRTLSLYEKSILILYGSAFILAGFFMANDTRIKSQKKEDVVHTVRIYEGQSKPLFNNEDFATNTFKAKVSYFASYLWAIEFAVSGIFILSVLTLNPFIITLMAGIWLFILPTCFFSYWETMPLGIKILCFIFLFISMYIIVLAFHQIEKKAQRK